MQLQHGLLHILHVRHASRKCWVMLMGRGKFPVVREKALQLAAKLREFEEVDVEVRRNFHASRYHRGPHKPRFQMNIE